MERYHPIDSVVSVTDYDEWYDIKFESRDPYFICQKDLIVKGTLEESEALFEGKIVRAETNKA